MQVTLPRSAQRFVTPGVRTSAILMLIMLLTLVISLVTADWTDGMGLLAPVILGGFVLGMLMSLSRWSGLLPILHSLITGTAWVLYWISRAPQVPVELEGAQRIGFVVQSFLEWLVMLFGEAPARSNLVFLLELAFLLWWLGYLAAWAVFREGKVWRAIIPVGLIMAVNMYFGPSGLQLYFAIFVVCALLLAVRSYLAEKELDWRYLRVRYTEDIQVDFLRDGLIFAVIVVILASLLPNAASSDSLRDRLGPLREPWEQVQAEWGRLFSSLNYQAGGVRPAFGDSLTLGGPRNLGDTVIMDVQSPAGRYWRAVAYDTYTGRRWLNTSELTQPIDAGTHVRTPDFQARREISQTVTTYYSAGGVLFGSPQPVRVSLGATADLGIIEEPVNNDLPLAEIMMLHRRGPELRDGQAYIVVSSVSEATVEDLQEAGADYPDWVRDRYLEVPPTVPDRVRELAEEVTAAAPTPYEKVIALEQYLRGYTYDDQIAPPPPGVDGVDYFLFEVRAGYCDYYASALAIMARSLGIPARVSAGYSQGEYNAEVDAYRVLESNGHSWPEVFFPGYGWIEFEPTASEEEIVRTHREEDEPVGPTQTRLPGGDSDLEPFGREPNLDEELGPEGSAQAASLASNAWWIGLLLMLLIVAAAVFLVLRPSRQRNRRLGLDPQVAAKLYGQLMLWAHRLRLPLLPSQTPNEHAAIFVEAVPEGRSAIAAITDMYILEQYSPYPPDATKSQEAASAWTGLQPLLRRAWLRVRLGPLSRLFPPTRQGSR